jgi:predicted RND superfamily exporter protein
VYLFFAIYLSIGIAVGLWMTHDYEEVEDKYGTSIGFVFVITVIAWFFIIIPAFIIAVNQWRKKEKDNEHQE